MVWQNFIIWVVLYVIVIIAIIVSFIHKKN